MKRFPLATLLVVNTLLVMFAIPSIFLFSAPKSGIAVDVSYLKGITLGIVPLTDVTAIGDQSKGFSALLFSELDQLKVLNMVPPVRMKQSLKTAGVSSGEEPDFSKIVKAGTIAGADIIVTGTINNYLMLNDTTSAISMSIYAINVHSGETVWSDNLTRSFEKTEFIDEGARLACTLAVKRMVEGMEKEKKAMRKSIPALTTSSGATTVPTPLPTPTQIVTRDDSNAAKNISSADALLEELLQSGSPKTDYTDTTADKDGTYTFNQY